MTAFAILFVYFHSTRNLVYESASIENVCRGTAPTPWQYRILIPTLAAWVEKLGVNRLFGLDKTDVALAIELSSVIAFFYALRALLAHFLASGRQQLFWSAVGMCALPFLYIFPRRWPFWYPWDLPAVLFTTLGILWIHEQRWARFYALLVVAALNRETCALMVIAFAVTQLGRMGKTAWALHCVAQTLIFVAIRMALHHHFREGQGYGEYWGGAFRNSWAAIHDPRKLLLLSTAFGYLWLPFAVFAPWIRAPFVRRVALLAPLHFVAGFSLGNLLELRIYGEVVSVVVLGTACGVAGWVRRRDVSVP